MKVVILGGTGMLGSMLVRVLSELQEIHASFRSPGKRRPQALGVRWFHFRCGLGFPPSLELSLGPGDWVVNAAGAIPQAGSTPLDMIAANALHPHELTARFAHLGVRTVHVTTDCVFSGDDGNYDEKSPHDAPHAYGKSKSLGEVDENGAFNIRCSIVGPEVSRERSLLEWVRSHKPGDAIPGFSNHIWNGVTTLALAKVIRGLVAGGDLPTSSIQHLVPAHPVSKRALVAAIVEHFNLDCRVESVEHGVSVRNMTLSTLYPNVNEWLWSLGGYEQPPGIEDMIKELAAFEVANESAVGDPG